MPPMTEQHTIVGFVEEQLSVIDQLEADLDTKLKATQGLRQSILRRAFAGELVPQDPTDEPASELLKRIAVERAARKTGGTGRRGRPRKRKPEKAA